MKRGAITVTKGATIGVDPREPTHLVITFEELKRRLRTGALVREIGRYREASLRTYRLSTLPKPFVSAALLRLLTGRHAWIEDEAGARWSLGPRNLTRLAVRLLGDLAKRRRLVEQVAASVAALEADSRPQAPRQLCLEGHPVYLRTDLWFGIAAGGSVGHIAGVLNNLGAFSGDPVLLTSDPIVTVRSDVETHVVDPENAFWDFNELPALAYNATFARAARAILDGRRVSFIYQRYSTNNYAGLAVARDLRVPFVLEYNGSEVWINRHWGKRLRYEALAERIELLNLRHADLVVVVSAVLRDELIARGVNRRRILINPNGVDTDVYSPTVDGGDVRSQLGLADTAVIGFIGTFGPWHGAEVLAEAVALLLTRRPELRSRLRLLMIGEGAHLAATRDVVARRGISDVAVFTGRVPQSSGPKYLAACDVLVAPHVPNPDGTPFFGSPTKLFEYMAMGRPIVASALDQIGEVLRDDNTALLAIPGDANSLSRAIERVVDDPALAARLAAAARAAAVERHTWRDHTRRIVEALSAACA